MQLSEHVYYYEQEHGVPVWGMSNCNTAVIAGPHGMALVDPGPWAGPHMGKVARCMAREGLRMEDASLLVLTHAHSDHAGAAAPLAKKLGATVLAHALEKPLLDNPMSFFAAEIKALRPAAHLPEFPVKPLLDAVFIAALGPHPPCRDVVYAGEGYGLGLGIPAVVVELPGHRPGEIGVYLPEERVLIIGDLSNKKRWELPSLNLPSSDLDQCAASVERIKALGVDAITAGHDPAVRGRARVVKWMDDMLRKLDDMKRVARRAAAAGRVDLLKLGAELRDGNPAPAFHENPVLAFNALKSIGYYG